MFDETMKSVWDRGGSGAPPLSRVEIEALLRPAARRIGRALQFLVAAYVAMLGVSALLGLVNLYGYRANATMLAMEGALIAVSGAFTALGLRLLGALRGAERADRPMVETIERRLAVYERWFESCLVVGALTPWLLTLSITTLVDNEHGVYRINHPVEFAVVTAVMLLGTYAILRRSLAPTVRETRAVLHDLRAEAIEETPGMERARRAARIWTAVGVVLLTLAVLFTFALWLKVI